MQCQGFPPFLVDKTEVDKEGHFFFAVLYCWPNKAQNAGGKPDLFFGGRIYSRCVMSEMIIFSTRFTPCK